MSKATEGRRVEREARLRWVPISLMRVSPLAQRDLNQARVDRIVASFDLEQFGTPTVNHRDGNFYVIDGQHRIAALKEIGWGDQQVQCWAYEGLNESEEAETFLKLNDVLAVNAFAKFRVGVQAGRQMECDIERVVRACGLRVSQDRVEGAISAVGTLRRVYERSNGATLARTLRLISDSYGDAGLEAAVIDGIALLCQRYDGDLDQQTAVVKLGSVNGGVNGLLNKAEVLRRQTGNQKGHCVAAAAVEIINAGRGGKKLPSWWREDVIGGAA
jgi:hypothetical protein